VHFWRTANGPEVDLVIEQAGGKIVAVECKFKEQPDIGDASGLRALADAERRRIKEKFVVCRTKVAYKLSDGTWVMNPADFLASDVFG
jgi:predicted AAA+ superfamily ATPase